MKIKNLGFVISLLFFGLALVAEYEVSVVTGFFETKDSVAEKSKAYGHGNFGTDQITLTLDAVPSAKSYNVYLGDFSGVKNITEVEYLQ